MLILSLTHVTVDYGLSCLPHFCSHRATSSNIWVNCQGRIVTYAAAVCVVYDAAAHTQKFFRLAAPQMQNNQHMLSSEQPAALLPSLGTLHPDTAP
jgi:hypothetical protein